MCPMNPRLLRPLSGFSPRQFAGLQLWLDGSNQSTVTLNGTTVSEWRSKVGGIALTQGTAAAQPTLTANYVNGRSALTFDGGDFLYAASAALAIAPSTSFLVIDETTAVNFSGLLVGTPASGSDFSSTGGFVTTGRDTGNAVGNTILRGSNVGAAVSAELVANSLSLGASAYGRRLVSVLVTESTASLRVGGVQGQNDSAHTVSGSSTGTLVGGRFLSGAVSASFRFNGRICEILHYSRSFSLAETQAMERWLAQRWGVTL
jgi:hypothetical protein